MMTFDCICTMAHNGNPLPETRTLPELRAWEVMSGLYKRYYSGDISGDGAKKQKAIVADAYDRDCLVYRMYAEGARRQLATENMVREVETNGCPICRRMMRVMDGRERSAGDAT